MIRNTNSSRQGNRGFTLLELLIAVSVIAVLAGLSVTVMIGISDQANEAATVTTIQKVNRLMEQRQEAFSRAFPAVEFQWATDFQGFVAQVIATQEGEPVARVRALIQRFAADSEVWRILGRKAAFRFEFPQRMSFASSTTPNVTMSGVDLMPGGIGGFNDANSNSIPDNFEFQLARPIARQQLIDEGALPATPVPVLTNAAVTTRVGELWAIHIQNELNANDPAQTDVHSTESSELLYFMMFHSGSYGASSTGEANFRRNEIADTDGDGFPEFVDAWDQPLRFYRWPTRLIDPSLSPAAFRVPNLPVIDAEELTDLQMTIGKDGIASVIGARTVDDDERRVADSIIRGLPRRLEFSTAYLTAMAAAQDNTAITDDVVVLIPPDPLLRDPDDPAGFLYSLLETGLPLGTASVDMSNIFNETQYHTPDTFHAPLIVSAGSDGLLGLYEPSDTGNLGHLAMYDLSVSLDDIIDRLSDNLSSRNRRAGAQR